MEPSAAYPPAIQALTERLRRFIRESVPEAEERVYKGGSGMGYHAPRCGAFCGLFYPFWEMLVVSSRRLQGGGIPSDSMYAWFYRRGSLTFVRDDTRASLHSFFRALI